MSVGGEITDIDAYLLGCSDADDADSTILVMDDEVVAIGLP